MNKFFYPGTEKIDKPGLERHHQLIESSTSQSAIQSQKKVRESLPNNWIYNDNKAKEVWSELEQFESCPRGQFKPEGPSPLQKIDESTAKLRNTITNFEVQDQEFLMEFLNLISDDSFVDSLDQSSILFEARYRLQQMIEEHIDFGERQATLLGNLTNWFTDVKNKEQDEFVSIASLKEAKNASEKLDDLRKLIDDYKSTSNGQLEKAENLHEDMIQNLNGKVNDCQKIISQKDLELTQLNQNLQQANSKRKGRVFNVRDSVHYDAELAYSQRRVMELQEQLNTLKTSLTEYTKIKKSNSLKEIMIMANLDSKNNENKEISSLRSERNSVAFTSLNVNDMNFAKLNVNDKNDGLISVEREIEFDSKLCVLANQIKNLKDDNKHLSDQIMQNRQNEIVNEKRYQSIERQKKTIESALQSTNKKMENMKESYERKIKDLQGDLSSGISLNKESENIIELKNNYESKIDKMADDYRKQIAFIQDSMDKKYQKQVNDIFRSCKNGDTSAALEQVTTNFQQQVLELERHFQKELKNEKRKNAEKIVDLTKHYESLIKKKDKEMEKIKNSVEAELQSRILDVKIEFDDKFNAKSFEDHENAVNEYNEIRRKMQGNIDMLREKLLKMTRERDTLKSLVDANDLALDLMDELNGNDADEEEEHQEENTTNGDDDVLQKSLFSLREKEIEQKVSEKFSLILKAQKENLQDYYEYQLENAKKFFKSQFQQLVSEFREKVVGKAGEVSDKLLNETSIEGYHKEIENLLVDTVKLSNFDTDYQLDELFRGPTIPISELDNKIEKYRAQIIELTSENELWKATFKHLQSHEKDGDANIVDSMKSVIEKQSKRMAEIDKENRILTNKLRGLSDSKIQLLSGMPSSFEIGDLVEFHLNDVCDDVNTNNEQKITTKDNKSNPAFNLQNKNNSSSNKNTQKQTENKTNANNTQNVPKGQICCFHCHSNYLPQNVSKQAIKCKISKCPKCNHLTLMPQMEEITSDQIIDDQIPKQIIKKPEFFDKDDISPQPPKPIFESVATLTDENGNINSKPKQELPQQFELQLTKQENQQAKEELEKALQRNQQMKDKLSLYEKNFGDLERQYIKKINKMNDNLSILQKNFVNDSLFIVHSAQQLPDEQQENLDQKISVSKNISEMLKNVEFPLNATAKTLHQQFIEFTDEKFNQPEISFEDANEALNQAESILLYLSNETEKTKKTKENNQDDKDDDGDFPTIEKDSVFFCKLNVCKMNIDILKEHNDFIAEIVKEILNQMKKMNNKVKQIGKLSINMAQNMKDELKSVSADLNMIIEQRTKAMNDAKKELLTQKTAYDSLQEKFRTSIAAFEQLQISSSTNHDEVLVLKRKEDDQVQTIENLTNKLLSSQENNRKNEKEIEQLKLRIMELESEQLLLSARLDTQKEMENNNNNNEDMKYRRVNSEEDNFIEEEEEIKNEDQTEPENNQSSFSIPPPLPSLEPTTTTNNEDEINEPCNFEFVPSFVVFSTNEINDPDSGRKKGFSLLPRRLALQQSKPVFADTTLIQSKQQTQQEEAQNNNATTNESRSQSSQKHEKIRVKYVQNNYQSSAISGTLNARVIVPKSKPKTSISRASTPSSNCSSSASLAAPSSSTSDNAVHISRVLSFENLIPLIENDVVTGSLIGYVTRYVPEFPPGKSLENQAKLREEKKKILRTSSVLISEVPPEKLRYDSNTATNTPNLSAASSTQLGVKSMISFGGKLPLNSVPSTTTTNSNLQENKLKSTRSVRNIERLPKTKAEWIDKLEKKIKSLESQIRDSSNLLQEERDKSHRAIQTAFKASVELKQCQRQQKKVTLLHDATKKRLEHALEMLSKSDSEIARLKKLLNEVSHIARSIEEKESNEKDNLLSFDDENHKAFPTKKRVLARPNKLAILTNFEDESKRLLSVFRGVCSGITSMAQKEIESIRKWAPKKDRYVNNEKMKLMSALEAMRFITSPDAYNDINDNNNNKKSLKSAVRVQSFEKKIKKEKLNQKRPVSRPVVQKNDVPISFEKATVTANMHNQKLPKTLKKGVIGRPATSHSNVV